MTTQAPKGDGRDLNLAQGPEEETPDPYAERWDNYVAQPINVEAFQVAHQKTGDEREVVLVADEKKVYAQFTDWILKTEPFLTVMPDKEFRAKYQPEPKKRTTTGAAAAETKTPAEAKTS